MFASTIFAAGGLPLEHRVAFERDFVGVVDEAIEDGIGDSAIAEIGMPLIEGELAESRSLRTRVCGQNSGNAKSTAETAVDAVDAMGATAGVVANAASATGTEAVQAARTVSTFGNVAGLIKVGVNAAQGDFWGATFNVLDSSVDFVSGLAAGAGAPVSAGWSVLAAGGFMASYHAAGGSEGIARAVLCD